MAANDVDAAEKKLQEIIDAAMEDGNIDEEEQKQIDEAKRELEKLRMRKVHTHTHTHTHSWLQISCPFCIAGEVVSTNAPLANAYKKGRKKGSTS
jgi:hypothetical protein